MVIIFKKNLHDRRSKNRQIYCGIKHSLIVLLAFLSNHIITDMYSIAKSDIIRILWIIFVITRYAEGEITSPPLNAAAEVNGQAVFNCSATSGPYAWTLTKDGNGTNGEIEITAGCVVISVLENHYRTEQPGGTTTCSLIVFDITMEQAGVYHCVHSDMFRVLLTVIDSSSTLTSNNTQDVIETETVVITCSINYNGSVSPAPTLRPHYYWTDVNGQNVSGSVDKSRPTDNKAVSELSVTAGRQDIVSHTCHIYLELDPHNANGYASNIPTVNNNANSPPIAVLYAPSLPNIVATALGFSDCQAMNLACYSDANPSPNYNWVDNIYGNVTNAQNITAEYGVNYTCTASNVLRNAVYSNSSSFHEASMANNTCNFALTSTTTSHSTQQPPRSTEQPPQYYVDSSAETAAIVLGVLLAISIAFHIICFFLYRKGIFKPRDSSESDVNKPTNNAEEAHYQDLCKETLAAKPEYEELPR